MSGNQIHRMGWKPDLPDHRDYLFAARPQPLPASVDLRRYCSPVQDQLELGSCTAHAIVGALEMLERLHHQRQDRLSRLFVYFQERVLEHTVDTDAGAQIRDGIKACAQLGVCLERLCRSEFRREAGWRYLSGPYCGGIGRWAYLCFSCGGPTPATATECIAEIERHRADNRPTPPPMPPPSRWVRERS